MIMDIGILYGVVAFSCALVNLIIQNRSNTTSFNPDIQKPFTKLLTFFVIFSFFDSIWGISVSPSFIKNKILLSLFTYTFHTGAALSAFMWLGYMLEYMKVKDKTKKIFNLIRYVIFTFQLCLLFQNIYTHNLFWITDDYKYVTTSYRNITFFVQFLYFGSVCFYALIKYFINNINNDSFRLKRYKNTFYFSFVPLIFGVWQMVFPDAPCYSIGFMITSIIIYGFNISVEYEKYIHELHKKENDELATVIQSLSANYEAIYCVDVKTNKYQNYIKNSKYSKEIDSNISIGEDFFEVLSVNVDKVVYEEDRKNVLDALKKSTLLSELRKNDAVTINYRLLMDDKPIYHQLKCVLSGSEDEEQKLIIGVFNIHEQMEEHAQQNENLKIAKEKAESANKAKSTFLFNMSHDIRTPMNAIQGYTDLVEKNLDDKEKVINYLSKIKQSNEHLLKLINNVLDMSRIENSKIVLSEIPFDVIEGMNKVISMIKIDADKKDIQVTNQFVDIQNRYVLADVLHLNQILINILNNAIKYTKQGGAVCLIVQQLASSKKGIIPMKIQISDTGIGMSKDFIDHIFEEFNREKSTTKSRVEGTGLGMSIVKRLVDLLGGTIEIESEEGKGTTVEISFSFKVCSEGMYKESVDKQTKYLFEDVDLSGRRALVVDDVEFNREIVMEVLQDENMQVDVADDGIAAVQKVKINPPNYYDIILMDVQMPMMDGYEATRQIRELGGDYKRLPIVAMTANAFEEDKENAINAGMNAHMAKPIKIDNLKNIINMFIN